MHCRMILPLGTLVLLLLKDTMGSLQQNTVLNGTSLVLTWNIRMLAGTNFFAFKIYEESFEKELAIIKKKSTVIRNPERLKGRVFNDSKSDLNTVPMVFRLRIGPMALDDDGLVILYQVIDTVAASDLTGQDSIKVKSVPYYCDSTLRLNEKYTVQRNSDLRLSTTLCGNPMPTVEWKFPDWVLNGESPLSTTQNITENNKLHFVYDVLLKNVDVRNCGKIVYFNASNENSYLTGNTTVNITGTPTKITGIIATEINGVDKCLRVSFNKVDVGLCDISYQVKFVFPNTTELPFTTICTMVQVCDARLLNSSVKVAALFNGIVGPYSDVNVNITKLPLPKITSTVQPTLWHLDENKVQGKYGLNAVIGSFFGGVFFSTLIGCAILFACRLYPVKSQEKSLKTTKTDGKRVDGGNYTALDTIQSQHGDYAAPSYYTEVADLKATKQSIYVNSV